MRPIRHPHTLPALALAATLALAPTVRAAEQSPVAALLERHADAVVNVRITLRTEIQMGGQGQNEETTLDVLGMLVDPSGLIMISNSQISSERMVDMMRGMGAMPEGFDLAINPTAFRVRVPGATEERRALLAATDSDLDLAFLQLERPGEEPLPAVDLASAVPPAVGEPVFTVARLERPFDHAPYVESARIGGTVDKPRAAWILDGELSGVGLPVFHADGTPAGVLTTVLSSLGDDTAGRSGGLHDMLGLVQRRTALGPLGLFVIPAAEVAGTVERARQRATELLEAAPPAEPPAGEGTTPEGEGAS